MEKKEMTAEVRSLALKILETALIYNSTPTEQEYTGKKPTFFVKFSGHCATLEVQCYPNGYDKHSLFFYVGGNVLHPLCESENRSESDIISALETIFEEMDEIYKRWQKKEELKMFDIDFGLAAAERQRENYLPHKKTLYHCYFCGGDICEGEECYYQNYKDVWICSDCIRSTFAED